MEEELRQTILPEQKEAVLEALRSPRFRWRTLRGVAQEARLDTEIVRTIIEQYPDEIVKSSIPSKSGEELFSTREHFRASASPWEKVMGALRYRAY